MSVAGRALLWVDVQIMSLKAHVVLIKLVNDELYVGNTVESFNLPSTASQFSKNHKDCIKNLFDIKNFTLKTIEIIKQTLSNKKMIKKKHEEKIEGEHY